MVKHELTDGPALIVGLGANLPGADGAPPRRTLERALEGLRDAGIEVVEISHWYESEPVPNAGQSWFVNAAVRIETTFSLADLLAELHAIEASLGRQRGARWGPRTIDLDLLAFADQVVGWDHGDTLRGPVAPHPRLHERAFALRPFCDLAPRWRHPVLERSASRLLADLGTDGPVVRRLGEQG